MQDIELPLPQNFTKYSHPWRRMPCPHPPIARRGWLVRCPPVCRPAEGSFCVRRPLVPRGRGRERALFSHPEWNLPSGCGLFPRKGKRERGRKEKGLQQRKEERTSRGRPEKTSKVPPESDEKMAWESQGPISQAARAGCDREKGGKDSWRVLPHSMQPFRLLSMGFS